MTRTLLITLLAMWPRGFPTSTCVTARRDAIAATVDESAARWHVPPALVVAVGFSETHLGCDANEGGGFGAPLDAHHRHTAGTVDTAVRILARSYAVCGTWPRAVTRFRSGMCVLPAGDRRIPYTARVLRLAARLGWVAP